MLLLPLVPITGIVCYLTRWRLWTGCWVRGWGESECWVQILTLTLTSWEMGQGPAFRPPVVSGGDNCTYQQGFHKVAARRGTSGTPPPMWKRYILALTNYCWLFSKSVLPVCTPTGRERKGSFPPSTTACYFHFLNLCWSLIHRCFSIQILNEQLSGFLPMNILLPVANIQIVM